MERRRLTRVEALSKFLDVVMSHRRCRIVPGLALTKDDWFFTVEIAGRWVIGVDRSGWRSRPFCARMREES